MANALTYLTGVQNYFGLGQAAAAPRGAFGGGFSPFLQPALAVAPAFGGRDVQVTSINVSDPQMLGAIRSHRREDREEDRASTASWVGAIGTIVLAGLSALALRSYCNDRKELKNAEEFKTEVLPLIEPNMRLELLPIVNKHIEIVENKVARGRNIMILTGLALTTGIAAFVGGMMSLQWLITTAIVAGVAIAAIGVFLVVWHCTENNALPPEMEQKIEALRDHLARA